MPNADDILWFKKQFHQQVKATVAGTPFSLNMLAAIAGQKTGCLWQVLRKKQLENRGRFTGQVEKRKDVCHWFGKGVIVLNRWWERPVQALATGDIRNLLMRFD